MTENDEPLTKVICLKKKKMDSDIIKQSNVADEHVNAIANDPPIRRNFKGKGTLETV